MTNTFIPTLGRHPLYCVWIATGNPSRPLACVWIDPELRTFQVPDTGRTAAAREESFPEKVLFASCVCTPVS